jgi:predicted secreted protein
MANETHTKLTKFYIGDTASPADFKHVAGVLGMPPIVQEKPDVDVTSLDSTAREYLSGLGVGDDIDIEFNWHRTDEGQVALGASYTSGDLKAFRVDYPDGTRLEFNGVVKSFGPGAALDEQIKGSAKIKISGDVTITDYTP